jgi:hypothetical protein
MSARREWWSIDGDGNPRVVFCTRVRAEMETRLNGAHGRKRAITRAEAEALMREQGRT